jgi:leucyl-tRNA synthetase
MGPHQNDTCLSPAHIAGVHRFLSRLSEVAEDLLRQRPAGARTPTEADRQFLAETHRTIHDVTEMMETDRRFHLAVARIMHLLNESVRLRDVLLPQTMRFAIESFALLLAPFAPRCAADAYGQLTGEDVSQVAWPMADPAFLSLDEREVIVQVDGKLRDRLRVKCDISREELTRLARRSAHAQEHIRGHEISREVVVPGRLVNFVTA